MAIASPVDYLISAQHESGGWGYKTGHKPVVEPTAAVLLAIRDEPLANDAYQRGILWLLTCQHDDGGWGINNNDPESGWHTTWALIVLKAYNQNKDAITRAVEWLITVATDKVSKGEFRKQENYQSSDFRSLVWPWLPGQVCWIEPTALAVLALVGITDSPLADARIKAAVDYFVRFRTPSGGWNVGNAGALDTLVIPRAYQTALVLMALAKISIETILPTDLSVLQKDMSQDPSILAQSAGSLAMRLLGENNETPTSHLYDFQLSDGSWDHSPFFTAWAVLGMRGYL